MLLFPVVLQISEVRNKLQGTVALQRFAAREALRLSAERSGLILGKLKKNKGGIPHPVAGNYWSISHKPKCVAAVISRERIGIDVEEIKPRPESLFDYLAEKEEWKLSGEKSLHTFFCYWTAKEATLKSMGSGIGNLKKCRVVSIPDKDHLYLEYQDNLFYVEHFCYRNHIISVVKDNNSIKWILQEFHDGPTGNIPGLQL